MSTAPPPLNPESYQQFHDEGDQISKSLQIRAGKSEIRFPSLVVQSKLPAPFSVLDSDLAVKEVNDAKFNLAYIANEKNSDNTIFISRETLGGFLRREFHPAMTNFRITQAEFDEELNAIEKIVWSFKMIKVGYVFFVIFMIISGILFLIGLILYNYDDKFVMDGQLNEDITDRLIASKAIFCVGLAISIITITLFLLIMICKLKNYEFEISHHLNHRNKGFYLKKNIHWQVRGFCRCLEITIYPLTPDIFWLMQTREGNNNAIKYLNK